MLLLVVCCWWTGLVAAKRGGGGGRVGGGGSKFSGGSSFGGGKKNSGASLNRNRNGVSTNSYAATSRSSFARPSSYSSFWNPYYRPFGFFGPAGYYHYGGYYRYSSYNNRNPRSRTDGGVCASADPSEITNCTRGSDMEGVLVCRELFSPSSGRPVPRTVCVDPSSAWETDTCGCCPGDAIESNIFEDNLALETSNLTAPTKEETCPGGRVNFSFQTACEGDATEQVEVCRQLFDPYESVKVQATLSVPSNQTLEGDSCGVCELDPDAPSTLISFQPSSNPRPICPSEVQCDPSGGGVLTPGVFVCREFFHPLTGASAKQTVCLPADSCTDVFGDEGCSFGDIATLIPMGTWANDQCGCCDGDCPESGSPISLPAPSCDSGFDNGGCSLGDGRIGTPVCRSLFHPLDGELRLRSLCLDPENSEGWASDSCGCCEEDCAGITEGTLSEQLLALAYEDPSQLEPVDYQENLVFDEPEMDNLGDAAFLAVVAVMLLGGIGGYFFLKNRKAAADNNNNSSQPTPPKPSDTNGFESTFGTSSATTTPVPESYVSSSYSTSTPAPSYVSSNYGGLSNSDDGFASGFGTSSATTTPAPSYVSSIYDGVSSSGGTYAPAITYSQPKSYDASAPATATMKPYVTQ